MEDHPKLSPFAELIMQGLKEAIEYTYNMNKMDETNVEQEEDEEKK